MTEKEKVVSVLEHDPHNPDYILEQIQEAEKRKSRGELKIFFGYAAGVGKTYAMLEAAQDLRQHGAEVVAGYIEPHTRPDTLALLEGLECLPVRKVAHGDMVLREFDLDAALKRHPKLILVDELAHTNAPASRHEKRYQDVEELLNAGIDVYSTVNVQHIESLNDMVSSITGVVVRERIPDSVFDEAGQVEIVDIEPQDLLKRLQSGKVYRENQAKRAMENFFTVKNLTALREIALRRCADRVGHLSSQRAVRSGESCPTEEHILVCLSSSPSNARIIRTAARMSQVFKGMFTALFVETPAFSSMSPENKQRLRDNIRLAEQLGAKIETAYGANVPFQIAEFARLSGVSKIVIGRSAVSRASLFGGQSLTDRLIAAAPHLDIHIIPDSAVRGPYRAGKTEKTALSTGDLVKSLIILVLATLIGAAFDYLHFEEANIITVYVLGVLITSVITQNRLYSMASSVISVLVFNFFFTEPRFSLQAYDTGYPVTFVIMFLAAFLTSSLAGKLKEEAKQSALVAFRSKILFDVNQSLQQAEGRDQILQAAASHLNRLLHKDMVMYSTEDNKVGEAKYFFVHPDDRAHMEDVAEAEKPVAQWVLKNHSPAGASSQTLTNAACLYLPMKINDKIYGIVGIAIGSHPLDSSEKGIVLSILGECALALENDKNARDKEEAAILARQEQLRANLLRAISHDLRTPLTSISGNASNFLSNGDKMDQETKHRLFTDIYDDSMWLINLVENLLAVTRLEDNRLALHLCSELVPDVIEEALRHINRRRSAYIIRVHHEDELLLARMDVRLIVQVIINLVDNAIKYTPAGSCIDISTGAQDKKAVISIADNGSGIPDSLKPRIFDMFYSGANKIADSRRSLGLGLSLCKSIITAHGGSISVSDNRPHGTVFTFSLPVEEVNFDE